MTAEPAGELAWSPNPVKQKQASYTIEDLWNLPPDAPRVELTEGVATVVPPPSMGHQWIGYRLAMWLERHAPGTLQPLLAVGVMTGLANSLEPDVVLAYRPVDYDHHYLQPQQVVLAVEIVSPSTRRRDRLEKPALYATAGIAHYWRIEPGPHVFAYDLVDGRYEVAADSAEELVLTSPFAIKLPIRDIAP
jgi:Uma2 family endonuclease